MATNVHDNVHEPRLSLGGKVLVVLRQHVPVELSIHMGQKKHVYSESTFL